MKGFENDHMYLFSFGLLSILVWSMAGTSADPFFPSGVMGTS